MKLWYFTQCLQAVTRDFLRKKVFLKISQNLQENNCARASFLKKLHAFPVNFVKLLRTRFLQNTSGRLLECYWSVNSEKTECFRVFMRFTRFVEIYEQGPVIP